LGRVLSEWDRLYQKRCCDCRRGISGLWLQFEIFNKPEFLELETLGPQIELGPEESVRHMETWTLFQNVPNGKDDAWIREAIAPLAFTS
jgi:hypothetical protein